MRLLNILTANTHAGAVPAEVIGDLQSALGSSDFTFMLPLEPELDKGYGHQTLMSQLAVFEKLRSPLCRSGNRCGILLQTTIGHADRRQSRGPAAFQKITGPDGAVCEVAFCPLDPLFRNWICEAIRSVAAVKPDFVLLDDDFRIQHHPPVTNACFCERHLQGYGEASGGSAISRSELFDLLMGEGSESDRAREIWQTVLNSGMTDLSRLLRSEMDLLSPETPIGICLSGNVIDRRNAGERARLLAGSGSVLVRVAGGVYGNLPPANLPERWDSLVAQRKAFDASSDLLVEADSFPHNLYSLPVSMLELHLRCILLLSFRGAKVWCRPIPFWNPGENADYAPAYRRVARQMASMEAIAPEMEWRGVSSPVSDRPSSRDYRSPQLGLKRSPWVNLLGALAIPQIPGGGGRGVNAFSGEEARQFSKEEWLDFLRGGVLLDGGAAAYLTEIGLAELIGVRAEAASALLADEEHFSGCPEWNGTATGEVQWLAFADSEHFKRLVPIREGATPISEYRVRGDQPGEFVSIAPAVTVYENALGGRVALYAAHLESNSLIHYRTPRRREQLLRLCRWLSGEAAPEFEIVNAERDLYFLLGQCRERSYLFLANLHFDTLSTVTLRSSQPDVIELEVLEESGEWRPIETQPVEAQDTCCIQLCLSLPFLHSVLLRTRTFGRAIRQ